MVYFNQNEKIYIQETFFRTSNDLRNIHKQIGEYRDYLITVVRSQARNIKYIIKNFDKINTNEKVNNMASNIMYYLSGMNNLSEINKRNELKKRIKDKGKIMLYTKILDDLNEVM